MIAPSTSLDPDRCYRAVESRDARFDGCFITGVTTTGIYCRPSCPTPIRPKRCNVTFFPTAAAAQRAGFRACKRCRPDASPGSPEWDLRADLIGRAMRLIGDGEVDRHGVGGLARRLAVSERHLHRTLVQSVGAGPLELARANRAQTARILIETTRMPFTDVAFAAGFSSIRQFNDTMREVFARTPTEMRRSHAAPATGPGPIVLRLAHREPLDAAHLFGWLADRAIPGVEVAGSLRYTRRLRLPRGHGRVTLTPEAGHIRCELELDAMPDLAAAVARCRRILDLDADPDAIAEVLTSEPVIAPSVAQRSGLRSPGAVDGWELAVRAIIGQQISIGAARTILGRLVERCGSDGFPDAEEVLAADLTDIGLTGRRQATIRTLAADHANGRIDLDTGADRHETRARLIDVAGIGPWTVDYITMRALGDPDVLLATDLVARRAADRIGLDLTATDHLAPWRSYLTHHLWASTAPEDPT